MKPQEALRDDVAAFLDRILEQYPELTTFDIEHVLRKVGATYRKPVPIEHQVNVAKLYRRRMPALDQFAREAQANGVRIRGLEPAAVESES